MANMLFRDRLSNDCRRMVQEAKALGPVEHAGLKGRLREIVVANVIKPILPQQLEVGTGTIVDSFDQQSAETDVIIYSRSILPPILYSERDGIFPIESCLTAIEIKSKVTTSELDDAISKVHKLRKLRPLYSPTDDGVPHVEPILFGLTSDISGKDELARYAERDADWGRMPAVQVMCIVGRGYWFFDQQNKWWAYIPPSEDHMEVVEFLGHLINSVQAESLSRAMAHFGSYVIPQERAKLVKVFRPSPQHPHKPTQFTGPFPRP